MTSSTAAVSRRTPSPIKGERRLEFSSVPISSSSKWVVLSLPLLFILSLSRSLTPIPKVMQSNDNCNSQQQAFMFGGLSPGGRYSSSSTNCQQVSPRGGQCDSVRSCMSWTNSLPSELQANSNYSWGGMGGGNGGGQQGPSCYNMPVQRQPQLISTSSMPAPCAPRAYMTIPGQCGNRGNAQPISIPIQVGDPGSKMCPLPAMKPLTINASLPTSGDGVSQPYTFQISADQYLGGGRC